MNENVIATSPERLVRQYTVSWTSMLRIADALWERHVDRLIEDRAGPDDLVALFGLSYVVEQLESSWDLNTLCNLRSAKTTLRSALEGLFQLTAVARAESREERRGMAVQILGQELSQKISRLEQIRESADQGSFDPEDLAAWEADLSAKSQRFREEFGVEPTKIPFTKLAEMGGIGSHFLSYLEDKIFTHRGLSHLENEPSVTESLAITHECCEFMLTALKAASRLLDDDMTELLDPHQRRIDKLKAQLDAMEADGGRDEARSSTSPPQAGHPG